jgi:hypothetical protein
LEDLEDLQDLQDLDDLDFFGTSVQVDIVFELDD